MKDIAKVAVLVAFDGSFYDIPTEKIRLPLTKDLPALLRHDGRLFVMINDVDLVVATGMVPYLEVQPWGVPAFVVEESTNPWTRAAEIIEARRKQREGE